MSEPVNVMLDLECFGTAPGCVLVSVGAVMFGADTGLGTWFYQTIDIQSCLKAGLTVDGETLKWWMSQTDDVRKEVKTTEGVHLSVFAQDFYDWIMAHHSHPSPKDVLMWGKGAAFDCAILRAALEAVDATLPWEPDRGNRCHRTLIKTFPEVPEPERVGTQHNGLDDAVHQANHNIAVHHHLAKMREQAHVGFLLNQCPDCGAREGEAHRDPCTA